MIRRILAPLCVLTLSTAALGCAVQPEESANLKPSAEGATSALKPASANVSAQAKTQGAADAVLPTVASSDTTQAPPTAGSEGTAGSDGPAGSPPASGSSDTKESSSGTDSGNSAGSPPNNGTDGTAGSPTNTGTNGTAGSPPNTGTDGTAGSPNNPPSDIPSPSLLCNAHSVASDVDGFVTCTFSGLVLPAPGSFWQECTAATSFGFGWDVTAQGADTYVCPAGSNRVQQPGTNVAHCIFQVDPMPSDPTMLEFNCRYLPDGVLSYSF